MAGRDGIQRLGVSEIRSAAQSFLAIVALVGAVSVVTGPRPVRVAATFAGVLLVPGAAITGFVRIHDLMTELLFAVVLSIAVAVAVSQVLYMLRVRNVAAGFALVAFVSAMALARHARGARRERAAEEYRLRMEAFRQARLLAQPARQPFRPNGRVPARPPRPNPPRPPGREKGTR